MVDAALMGSSYQDWQTPPQLFAYADTRYGPFTLDAAADEGNALVRPNRGRRGAKPPLREVLTRGFLTEEDDALGEETHWSGRVWVNPPYGRGVHGWPMKAAHEVLGGYAEVVVMLLGARTDTKYWATIHETASEVVLLNGRLTFKGACADKRPKKVTVVERNGKRVPVCGVCGLRVRVSDNKSLGTARVYDEHIYDPAPFPSALIIWRRGYYGPARYEQLKREVWR